MAQSYSGIAVTDRSATYRFEENSLLLIKHKSDKAFKIFPWSVDSDGVGQVTICSSFTGIICEISENFVFISPVGMITEDIIIETSTPNCKIAIWYPKF